MSRQLLLALIVEALLMTSTTLLLIRSFSGNRGSEAHGPTRAHALTRASGFVMLFLTFCWSVVFGIVLGLHRLPLLQ